MQISTHSNNNQQPTTGYQVAASGTYNVAITDYMFSPSQLIIRVGDTVIWTNDGSMGHTLTSDSGNELNSPIIASGSTYSHTFNIAGTYNYHCSIHSSMIGQIIVQ
jgi:plastocyanin